MAQNPDRNLYDEFKRLERLHGKIGISKGKGRGRHSEFTPDIIRKNIIKYFQFIQDEDRYASINGLALHIGFRSRKHMIEFRDKPAYTDVIQTAMSLVELTYEIRLKMPDVKQTGVIFALKNMGWEDKQIIESSTAEDTELADELQKVSEEKLRKIQALLRS